MHITEYVRKAIEVALANAVYHQGYDSPNTIEINVRLDCIEILSFPGPPVDNKQLKRVRVVARDYRNRRIGDFLKELGLTEGRSTGIPKMLRACKRNGSPMPGFETDEARTYFLATIPVHQGTAKGKPVVQPRSRIESGIESLTNQVLRFLEKKEALSKLEIAQLLGHEKTYRYLDQTVAKLVRDDFVEYTIPTKPNSRLQKYRMMKKGRQQVKNQGTGE